MGLYRCLPLYTRIYRPCTGPVYTGICLCTAHIPVQGLYTAEIGVFSLYPALARIPLFGPVFSPNTTLRPPGPAQDRGPKWAPTPEIGLFAHRQIPQNQEQMHICGPQMGSK